MKTELEARAFLLAFRHRYQDRDMLLATSLDLCDLLYATNAKELHNFHSKTGT